MSTFSVGDRVLVKAMHGADLPPVWEAVVVDVDPDDDYPERIEVAWCSRFTTTVERGRRPTRETWDDRTAVIEVGYRKPHVRRARD